MSHKYPIIQLSAAACSIARKMPGLGMMPWKTIFDALKLVGYQGPVAMEPFVIPGGEIGSAVSLYREIMDISDYEEDIKTSLRFVRSLLK